MANKPTAPIYPLGLVSTQVSEFISGLLNHGLIEHSAGAILTVPEDDTSTGVVSAIRYNGTTDEFEGYYSDGWRTMGGGGGRWETPSPSNTYTAEVGRGYLIDSRSNTSTFTLGLPKKIGDAISISDVYGAFADRPLTIDAGGKKIYGDTSTMTLTVANMAVTFTWSGEDHGWVVTAGVGLGQGRVYNRVVIDMVTTDFTSSIDLNYTPQYLDIYVDGLLLSPSKYTIVSNGLTFSPDLQPGSELIIKEYTPVDLLAEEGRNTYTVVDQAAMLALAAKRGDTAVISSTAASYRLNNYPASVLSNWVCLTPGVLKVNGQVGNVVVAKTGVNNDITSLTALSGGPLTLGGDAVGDYDAVTYRQARNLGGGTGPTQSGVMNFGIGSRRLHDSRAFIPTYELPADGQLLSRASYPDLWAYAQLVGTVTEADWCSYAEKRGKFSVGNGTTTFRMPDLNGVKKAGDESNAIIVDSVAGLFGRGDGGVSSSDGVIYKSALPNIAGSIPGVVTPNAQLSTNILSGSNGFVALALGLGTGSDGVNRSFDPGTTAQNAYGYSFNASNASAVYGRDSTTEVRPNSFVGVWVIRATGAFTAANTAFHVINADTAVPASGTVVRGGDVFSDYQVAGANYVQAIYRAKATIGGVATAELVVRDSRGGSVVDTTVDVANLAKINLSFIRGLDVTINASTVNVGIGSCALPSGDLLTLTAGVTVTIPTLTASTWYHIYLYNNSGTITAEISTTAPVDYARPAKQKTGDATRRYLASLRSNASSQPIVCYCANGECSFLQNWSNTRVLGNGTATTETAISLAAFTPTTAYSLVIAAVNNASQDAFLSSITGGGGSFRASPGGKAVLELPVFYTQNLYYWYASSTSAGLYLDLGGYHYER